MDRIAAARSELNRSKPSGRAASRCKASNCSSIPGSLRPAARKASETELLRAYHQALLDGGVSGYSWEQCWDDYRVATLFCVAYPVVAGGQIDLGNERGVNLVRKMALRSLGAATDLDVQDLLGRFEESPPFTG